MTGDLIINGKDAWITWGVNMSDSFLETLCTPPPIKPLIENKSSSQSGKQVYFNKDEIGEITPCLWDERDVNLTITLEGNNQSQYLQRYESFLIELQKGLIKMSVTVLSKTYHLTYLNSSKKLWSRDRTIGKFTLKFNEPNPANRIAM